MDVGRTANIEMCAHVDILSVLMLGTTSRKRTERRSLFNTPALYSEFPVSNLSPAHRLS
jgi:hypothetical protein